jgi:hypothetical protein
MRLIEHLDVLFNYFGHALKLCLKWSITIKVCCVNLDLIFISDYFNQVLTVEENRIIINVMAFLPKNAKEK